MLELSRVWYFGRLMVPHAYPYLVVDVTACITLFGGVVTRWK